MLCQSMLCVLMPLALTSVLRIGCRCRSFEAAAEHGGSEAGEGEEPGGGAQDCTAASGSPSRPQGHPPPAESLTATGNAGNTGLLSCAQVPGVCRDQVLSCQAISSFTSKRQQQMQYQTLASCFCMATVALTACCQHVLAVWKL